jgi:hypothetical protein
MIELKVVKTGLSSVNISGLRPRDYLQRLYHKARMITIIILMYPKY